MKCPLISHAGWVACCFVVRAKLHTRCGGASGEDGFTLIEVLVSLTILSISMGVLLAVFLQGLDRSREGRSESEARVLAQSLLAQADTAANPSMGSSAGKAGEMTWRLRVVPFGSTADRTAWQESPAQILATVTWRGDGGMRSVTLSTLRLLPKPNSDSDSDSNSDSDSQ